MRRKNTFFAVASLGKERWYWVVWPSLDMLQSGVSVQHLADGYERTKAEAVDRALEVAGMDGEWVAAKYAKAYHRQASRERRTGGAQGYENGPTAMPGKLEFVYHDIQDKRTKNWRSVPHRVVRKTRKYVYINQSPYDPDSLTGTWLDHDAPTFRLNRDMLEREGYAFVPVTADIDDPLFFTIPYQERVAQYAHGSFACLDRLGLSFPCSIAEVKAAYRELAKRAHPDHGGSHDEFLALQAAYEQALHVCRYTA